MALSVSRALSRRGRKAVYASWLRTADRAARTAPGRAEFLSRFSSDEERRRYFRGLAALSPRSKKKTDTASELAVPVREAANADRVSAA
jgi:hypothetical protein